MMLQCLMVTSPSLLLVCIVMIAMVMVYQHSNNDLIYVVNKQPTSRAQLTSALAAMRLSTTEI